MRARVLRGEVAAACVQLLHRGAPIGKGGGEDGPGLEALQRDVEPVADGARVLEQDEWAADRVDRDAHPAVVVEVGGCEATADDLRQSLLVDDPARIRERAVAEIFEHLDRTRVTLQIRDGNRAVREDQIGVAAVLEVDERVAPAGGRWARERLGEHRRLGAIRDLPVRQ